MPVVPQHLDLPVRLVLQLGSPWILQSARLKIDSEMGSVRPGFRGIVPATQATGDGRKGYDGSAFAAAKTSAPHVQLVPELFSTGARSSLVVMPPIRFDAFPSAFALLHTAWGVHEAVVTVDDHMACLPISFTDALANLESVRKLAFPCKPSQRLSTTSQQLIGLREQMPNPPSHDCKDRWHASCRAASRHRSSPKRGPTWPSTKRAIVG
eukprot:scaffold2874_cov384-Prasinococcus_capsulatus_cf.AAC.8